MTDNVRCPSCRGAKQVTKLGGIVGDCNTCKGKGEVLASSIPKPVEIKAVENVPELVQKVADCVPASSLTATIQAVEPDIKIDGKKALYKRKVTQG